MKYRNNGYALIFGKETMNPGALDIQINQYRWNPTVFIEQRKVIKM